MCAYRRTRSNFALQRAVELANQLSKPLVILEAIQCNTRWACDRFHQFILNGMSDNVAATLGTRATYCAFVETRPNQGKGLVESFGAHANAIIADDYPCFFYPSLYQRIAIEWHCAIELVDSNTVLPMRCVDRTFTVAHSYRRFMQKQLFQRVPVFPEDNPLEKLHAPTLEKLPEEIASRWCLWVGKQAADKLKTVSLASLPIDHSVSSTDMRGGYLQAKSSLDQFIKERIGEYSTARNEPELEGSSGLSPYLHFGHLSAHEIFNRIAAATDWSPAKLNVPNGKMDGFWNMGENADAFIDQLMTWREIGFNMCWRERNYDRYESLPLWAQKTLEEHEADDRPFTYTRDDFEQAQTHDPLWNAAQRQLVKEGRIHNYLRMLWGKKILHWTKSPREALKVMIQLNNKYALDGRDPNSYSGIFWVLGRYDRAWGPERPIFGKVRYMTSESTRNKFRVKKYIEKHLHSS
jgi:deoxyribodipyrimidine photo-lyase